MSSNENGRAAANTLEEDRPDRKVLALLVAEADTGGRKPRDQFSRAVFFVVPLLWALFQLWYASPLPFQLGLSGIPCAGGHNG